MKTIQAIALSLVAICVVVATQVRNVDAADHLDPNPRVSAGDAADIGDLYVWASDDTFKAVFTFAGPVPAGTDAAYDRDVIYTINIDGADEDNLADHSIEVRFGQNEDDEWGLWAAGVPGSDADVVGAVETNIESGSAMVFAGQRDDPFFFDLQGFQQTLETATLAFDSDRDFFAGQNINAIVLEFPVAELDFDGPYNFWATTSVPGDE